MPLKKLKILVLFIGLNFTFYIGNAQEFAKIENVIYGTKLQNNNILCILQDSQGFLWVGTNWGLYRYDGYVFKEYLATTTPSIIHNNVKSLLLDGDNLWIGTRGGITILNTRTYKAYNIPNNNLADTYVTKIIKDKSGVIWVTYFTNKLSKYIGEKKFQHFTISVGNETEELIIKDIVETSFNKFYLKFISELSTYASIVEVKIDSNTVNSKIIIEKNDDKDLFLFNKNDSLYVTENNYLFKLNTDKSKLEIERILFKKDTVQNVALVVGNNATIYLGTQKNSFYNLNNKTLLPENYTLINEEKPWVNTFFVDNSGLLWVGTTNGLFKVKNNPILFNKYLSKSTLADRNKMRSIIQDYKNDIYTVNDYSLFKYDSILDNFVNLNWKTDKSISNPYSIIENDKNTFLVGTQSSGIIEYNKITNSCKPYLKSHQKLYNKHVIKLLKDENEILWIGTLEGLYYLDEKNDSLLKVEDKSIKNKVEIKEAVFDIQSFGKNKLWVGTSTGLYLLTVEFGEFPLKINIQEITKVPFAIRCLVIDKDIIWIATQTNGVVKYNSTNGEIELIDTDDGLSNNTVYSILQGSNNEFWFGTFNGLSRYNVAEDRFLNYYEYDGLANNEFNSSSQLKANNGNLYFGGQNGISVLYPKKFKPDSTNFKLNVSGISWYNSKKDEIVEIPVDNSNLKPLILPYNANFLTIEFSLTDYFKPKNNTFKYKIKGLQNEWTALNKSNILSFTNFPSGDYILEVMASTNYGNWNKQTILLPLKVEEIFYKRWWFITSWGILTLFFFYIIRKYELNHIKKMEKLRLRISKDLHDELGSSLTGVAIRADLINEQIDQETKNKFLNEISIQSRSAVDSLSDIVWALDSTNNSIQDLYDRMESILFKLLTPLKISYSFTPYEVNKYLGLKPDYKQHLFLIFKEAVTNIVKHSNATNVDVTITKERRKLKLKIHDNGTNFKNEKNSLNGYGIKNMKSRADKIKGELKITVKDGFIIELWFDYLTQKPT